MTVILIWCVYSVGHDDIGSLVLVSKGACPALLSGSTCFLEGLQDLVSVARMVHLHVLSEPAGRKEKRKIRCLELIDVLVHLSPWTYILAHSTYISRSQTAVLASLNNT